MSAPLDADALLLQHGRALRGLAAELVRDQHAADDAVQETWAHALSSGPRHTGALGGWLRTVLVNVVAKLRRSERRRLRREEAVARVRGDAAPDHADVLAREEVAQRLLAEVRALDVVYRDTIWARYFEGHAPRAIAAAHGVPVATVKSRLQRGLAMLRARLDGGAAGNGTAWRRAFVIAFGMRSEAMVAALASGGAVMTWAKATTAAVAVAAISMFWWLPQSAVAPSPIADGQAVASQAQAASLPAAQHGPADAAASPSATEARREPAPTTVDAARVARLLGRCVDAGGQPIAGCEVRLSGRPRQRDELAMWSLDHPDERWHDPDPVRTAAAGRFEFVFVPLPPLRFALSITAGGRANTSAQWRSLQPGSVIDVGDVCMQPGVEVRGRVVHEDGQATENAMWILEAARDPFGPPPSLGDRDGTFETMTMGGGPCRIDGRFTTWRVPAGEYTIRGQSRSQSHRQPLALPRDRDFVDVEIVLPSAPSIRGRVVDEAGAPIPGAEVGYQLRPPTRSQRDGTFVLARPDDFKGDAVAIHAFAEGFERGAPTTPIAWGTNEVELRLQRAAGLTVAVRDEGDVPIEAFAVRCVPLGGTGHFGVGSNEGRIRAQGPFADGVASVPGISSGRWRVIVEFPATAARGIVVDTIDVPTTGLRHVVRSRDAMRLLRVVRADGAPVSGTRVAVVDRCGAPPHANERAMEFATWVQNAPNRFSMLQRCTHTTGAEGRVLLRAPAGIPLSLHVLGPGHVPVVLEIPQLDGEPELVVTVGAGARLIGRIATPGAMQELARLAAPTRRDVDPLFTAETRPELRIAPRANATAELATLPETAMPVADDGSFQGTNLPSGDWTLQLWLTTTRGRVGTRAAHPIGSVQLTADATTHRDVDIEHLLPGTLTGRLFWNGAAAANAQFHLEQREPTATASMLLRTDEHGAFSIDCAPGTWRVQLLFEPGTERRVAVTNDQTAIVVRGRTTTQQFLFAATK